MTELRERVALITGASSGIGAELARELARRGCHVGLLARREDRLVELAESLRATGSRASWATADVSSTEATHAALDALATELGGCDIAIANAGYGRPEPPAKFEPGRAMAMYDVNLLGTLRVVDWALPRFLDQRSGHLVGIASVASYFGLTHAAAYCGSKAAMRVHLQSLRLSLRPKGIAVTTICPGFVKSELTDLNKAPMPFMWPTEKAARRIADSIERRRREDIFPWQMKLLVILLTRLLPNGLAERMLSGRRAT